MNNDEPANEASHDGGSNVVSMAKHSGNAKHTSVLEMLRQAAEDIEKVEGGFQPNKAVLLLLDDSEGKYVEGFYNAGMKTSELAGFTKIMSDKFSLAVSGLIEL